MNCGFLTLYHDTSVELVRYVLSVLCTDLMSWKFGWSLSAPGIKVSPSVTLLYRVIAEREERERGEREREMCGRPVLGVLWQWSWTAVNVAAKSKREVGNWKVVFVRRPCRHTVVQSLVQLGAFSHWQTPVWWRQDRAATAVSTLQALLPRGDPGALKKQQHLVCACYHGSL